jgi:hypothetical protein
MPLNAEGEIQYIEMQKAAIRYQADPPVCNCCKQDITRESFGWMYWEGHARGKFEFIECRACTMMRAGGQALRLFLKHHRL